jgi:hypothetical protein
MKKYNIIKEEEFKKYINYHLETINIDVETIENKMKKVDLK